MSNSRSQINSNFYQIANTDPTCGNITGINVGTVQATGNITAAYYFGNGSGLTGVTATSAYGNANVAAYLASNAAVTISTTSNIATAANVSGAYIIGNGALLTGLPASYSNADVANYLPTYGGNISANNVAVTSNVSAGYFVGNGAFLTGLPEAYSNANVAAYLASNSNVIITTTGNIWSDSTIRGRYVNAYSALTVGDVTGASYSQLFDDILYVGRGTGAESRVGLGIVSTTGNVVGNNIIANSYVYGNGAFLTGLPDSYGNANVADYLSSNSNITITTTGNITANYFIGNGSALTDVTFALQPAVVDFTFSGETSNGVITDEFVSYAFSSDYLNGNNNVSGNTWTEYTTAAGDKVAVSDTGVFVTDNEYSINGGTTWATLGSSPATIFGIAFGNVSGTPTWVRVNSSGVIQYNTNANGIPTGSWTTAATFGPLLYAVAYGNGVFLTGGTNSIYRSTTGTSGWTSSTGTSPGGIRSLLWDGSRWLASGANGLLYSTDNGATWTAVGSPMVSPTIGFTTGLAYNGTTNGIYRISGGAATTLFWCNGNPTVAANWVVQTSVANINGQDGQMAYIANQWYVTGGGSSATQAIWRSSSGNANAWIVDTLSGKGAAAITGLARGPNAIVTSSTNEVYRIPFNPLAIYTIGLPADSTYGANTLTFAPSSGANANVAAVELGNLIVANRPAYSVSYANSRVTLIDTNSGGDITGAFTILVNLLSPNGTITLSVNDGANAAQDVITFIDPVTSATYQYSPAFNSNISNIVTDIGTSETLPDWLGNVFSSDTVRFTSDIPGYLPVSQLIDASITNGLSNGVTTTLAVTRNIESLGFSGATVPGGNDTELQFNDNGSFAGTNGIYYNAATSLLSLPAVIERVFTTSTPMTGNIDYDVQNQGILYYNVNATANANINFRGYSGLTLDNTLQTDDSVTVKLWNRNGATAYLPVNYKIDGSNITPVWLNGTAPTAANANSTMQYTYTIVKTAANTYTVLASQQRFA